MKPEYILELADSCDPDELWRLSWVDQKKLSPEKRKQLDAGVALRRHADHVKRLLSYIGTGQSLLITVLSPNGTASMSVDTPEKHKRLIGNVK